VNFHPVTTIAAVLVDPDDPQSIFVGTLEEETDNFDEPIPGGLFHSADGGQSWAEVSQPALPFPGARPPFSYGVFDLAILPATRTSPATPPALFALAGLLVFRSTDSGASWQSIAPVPPPLGEGYTYSLAVVRGSPDTLFSVQQIFSNDGFAHVGLFSSRDLGATWTRVDDGTIPNELRLVVAPNGELYSVSIESFSHGEGGGAHWRRFWIGSQLSGFSSTFPSGGLLRWSRDGSRLYSLAGSRLYQSTDGGRSWIVRSQIFSASFVKVTDVQIDPSRPATLFITTDVGVYRSDDGGASWKGTEPPPLHPEDLRSFNTLAIVPGALVGGGYGVERSTDGGRTWRQTLSRYTVGAFGETFLRYVTRLRADPQRSQVLYAEVTEEGEHNPPLIQRILYRSTDGGVIWHRLAAGATLVAVDPSTPQTLYLMKKGHLLRSLDDGRTWKVIGTPPLEGGANDLLVDRADPRTLYVADSHGVYRSTDGGVTWSPFSTGLRGSVRNLLRDPRRPVLYTGAEGLFQIDVP
jgi:photosystem II stability/assembly factor-like uncharacterized protein